MYHTGMGLRYRNTDRGDIQAQRAALHLPVHEWIALSRILCRGGTVGTQKAGIPHRIARMEGVHTQSYLVCAQM